MLIYIIVIIILTVCLTGLVIYAKMLRSFIGESVRACDRANENLLFLWDWMNSKRRHPDKLSEILKDNAIECVAIYGAGYLGMQVFNELKDTNVNVNYFIDGGRESTGVGVPVYKLREGLPEVDAVIISVIYSQREIIERLRKVLGFKIFLLEDLI